GRPGGHGAPAAVPLRPGLGPGLPRLPADPPADPDRQRQPGPAACLSQLGGPLEILRTRARRAVRPRRFKRESAVTGRLTYSSVPTARGRTGPGPARAAGPARPCPAPAPPARLQCVAASAP